MKLNKKTLIGMPTLIELNTLADNIKLCTELKLNLVEINMNLPQFQINELKKIDKDEEIALSLHLPEELNVWGYDNNVRNAYIETLKESIDLALDKNIRILNMHMNLGVYFTLPNEKILLFEKYQEDYIEKTIIFAEEVNKLLSNTNTKIYIENTGIYNNKFITNAINKLLEYDCFNLTWDIGHDSLSGNNDFMFIMDNINRVKHMHLHDAIKLKKDHLPLGQGKLDLKVMLSLVKGHIESIIIETKTVDSLKVSVEYFNRKLYEIFV